MIAKTDMQHKLKFVLEFDPTSRFSFPRSPFIKNTISLSKNIFVSQIFSKSKLYDDNNQQFKRVSSKLIWIYF